MHPKQQKTFSSNRKRKKKKNSSKTVDPKRTRTNRLTTVPTKNKLPV